MDTWLLRCEQAGELTSEDRRALRDMLGHTALQRLVGIACSEMQGKLAQFRTIDYTTPKGQAEAVRLQGALDGMNRLLSLLWDEAQEEQTNG